MFSPELPEVVLRWNAAYELMRTRVGTNPADPSCRKSYWAAGEYCAGEPCRRGVVEAGEEGTPQGQPLFLLMAKRGLACVGRGILLLTDLYENST